MEAKEILLEAHAALVQCEYGRAIGYYEKLLQQVMADRSKFEILVRKDPKAPHKRRRNMRGLLLNSDHLLRDLLLGYATAMACCDDISQVPLDSAFQVYRQLFLNELPIDGQIMERLLRNVTAALVEQVRWGRRESESTYLGPGVKKNRLIEVGISGAGSVTAANNDLALVMLVETCEVDALLCGICDDLLKFPVTVQCGHTFCRQCAGTLRRCIRCPIDQDIIEQPQNGGGFEKDVFISRLVDKWWGSELKVQPRNENARLHLDAGHLDQALRCANESLEQGECWKNAWWWWWWLETSGIGRNYVAQK